ncbi:MAG: protein jag [Acetatifactor muris]|nr:protein jag [Acetatifactor muris]MCM1525630.1 protein jag [Bacteroides sp.]
MEFIEVSAKNMSDAITEACRKLGVTSDRLYYEVIEEGSNGFLGIGSKPAVIKAAVKDEKMMETEKKDAIKETVVKESSAKETVAQNDRKTTASAASSPARASVSDGSIEKRAQVFLDDVFKAMDINASVNVQYDAADRSMDVEISGDEMGILIGKRGQTLDSLQYLVSLVVNKGSEEYIRVKVDTENYRERRRETLENLAKNIAYKVKRTKRPVSLEPMNPYERRIIHYALQDDKYVTTHSEGDEPFRRVVVTLKRQPRN